MAISNEVKEVNIPLNIRMFLNDELDLKHLFWSVLGVAPKLRKKLVEHRKFARELHIQVWGYVEDGEDRIVVITTDHGHARGPVGAPLLARAVLTMDELYQLSMSGTGSGKRFNHFQLAFGQYDAIAEWKEDEMEHVIRCKIEEAWRKHAQICARKWISTH